MAVLSIILAVLNVVAGEWSATGRRLVMNQHPVVLRMRWFALGAVAALFLIEHDFARDDWISWVIAAVLAFSVARFPVGPKLSDDTGQPSGAANRR